MDSVELKHVTRDTVDDICQQITASWPRTRREITLKKAVKRSQTSQAADAQETQSQTEASVSSGGGGRALSALSSFSAAISAGAVAALSALMKKGGSAATAEMADCKGSGTRGKVPQVRDQGMIDITDRHALLIGNSDYQGTLRDGVSRCTKDAEDMAGQLACDTLGVYKFTTMVLVNRTKQEIENSIREWARGLPRRCVALVKFAGHGLEAQGNNYLVPVDAPENMLEAEIEYNVSHSTGSWPAFCSSWTERV